MSDTRTPRNTPLRKIFKIDRKTFFNPSGWVDADSIESLNRTIIDVARGSFLLPKPDQIKSESFEQAMKRQGLTKKDVEQAGSNYQIFAYLFVALGLVDFIYTMYLVIAHFSILGFILGAATTALFFGQAFRFDFWAFQIKRKKLGTTFAEWKQYRLGNKGSRT